MEQKKPLLRVRNLKKSYDAQVLALKGISVDFYSGEYVVIIGSSGSGKSTFIRCINRMIDPTEGTIKFEGEAVEKLKGKKLRSVRAKIGMIFQNYNLVGRTSVIKNVMHGKLRQMPLWKSIFGLYAEEDKREAMELLEQVGLSEQVYKRADALSGGQMQRVGICRAILQHPKILLADEPIASLDPKSADIVMEQLHEITTKRGLTCIVNLHQVDYAKRYATRIIGIKAGQIAFDGSPAELTDEIIADIYAGKKEQMKLEETQQTVSASLRFRPEEG